MKFERAGENIKINDEDGDSEWIHVNLKIGFPYSCFHVKLKPVPPNVTWVQTFEKERNRNMCQKPMKHDKS